VPSLAGSVLCLALDRFLWFHLTLGLLSWLVLGLSTFLIECREREFSSSIYSFPHFGNDKMSYLRHPPEPRSHHSKQLSLDLTSRCILV
jgi:hypothetical protein